MARNYKKYEDEQNLSFEEAPVEVAEESVIETEPQILEEETVENVEAEKVEEIKVEAPVVKEDNSLCEGVVTYIAKFGVEVKLPDGSFWMAQGHTDSKIGDVIRFKK